MPSQFLHAHIRRGDPQPMDASERHLTLSLPLAFPERRSYEKVYALHPALILEPRKGYRISGRIRDQQKNTRIFKFKFRTDHRGMPVAYRENPE